MAATHHFYGHSRPLPPMQILNDGSFFSFGYVIMRNAKRLQRLADDILDVTKIESESLEPKEGILQLK